MAPTHVLRVHCTDDPSACLLLNVTQTSDTRPLDLKLVATEHEHLYHGSVKDKNVAALRASRYTGDDDEWRQLLAYTLLQERAAANLNALHGLEVVAAVSGETCTLSLRRKFGGVVQPLGSIILSCDDEREEVSAFDWVETAVASSDGLRSELATLQASLASQHAQVASLTSQLDELVKAKKDHEEQLLRKCAALLDTKRAKIRDQQRKINAVRTEARKAGTSSRGKRGVSALDDDSGNEDADADAYDYGDEEEDDDGDEEGQRTPEQDTEDEGSDDGFAAPSKIAPTKSAAPTTARQARGEETASEGRGKDGTAMEVDLPPRRELPFARRAPQKDEGMGLRSTRPSAPPPAEEEEEEEDDDDTDDEL
jgi:hypothetical protein